MMLEWAAEQPTDITTTAIDLEFVPTDTNEERGVQNLEFVLQQMHTELMALTSYEANDIVANSRKNPLGMTKIAEAMRSDDRRKETKPSAHERCSLLDRTLEVPRVSLREKDEGQVGRRDQLVGLEALVPEGLEKRLILNSNRLRTFEDARLEIVTYVQAKFGLRTRDSKRSDTVRVDTQIPWMLMRSTLFRLAKEKGHRAA